MFPYLYQSPDLTIGSYGVMLAVAYLVGRFVFIRNIEKQIQQSINLELLIISMLIFGVIGAKLMFLFKNTPSSDWLSWQSLTSASGFSSQGALMAALLVAIAFARLNHIRLSSLLDAAAPAAIIAYALARVGCFLAGDDCWGIDSQLPWSMSFPNGIKPTLPGQTVHPIPIYEVLYSLLIWQYLNIRSTKKTVPYSQFFMLLLLWGMARFLVEFISTNPIKILLMSGSQFGGLLMFISAVIFFSYSSLDLLSAKKKPR